MSILIQRSPLDPAAYERLERNVESFAPAFTSVNGRTSISPVSNEQKAPIPRGPTTWSSVSQPPKSGYSTSTSPTISSGHNSPESPNKRRRSDSDEDLHTRRSPDEPAAPSRQQPGLYLPRGRDDTQSMENPQPRLVAPVDRHDIERRWATEPREMPHNAYQDLQHREPRPTEPVQNSMPPLSLSLGTLSEPSGNEGATETEVTRAGVQVELKKRKRQFANRTKTGCGTCRRRKKKCDEAKPECNNCTRGGFICEGYANKVPWPKNGIPKPPPPLQAKERMAADVTSGYARCAVCNQIHIPHCDAPRGSSQSSFSTESHLPNGHDGARGRPIHVEEHERKPPTSSSWGNGWSEQPPPPPPRVSYPPEHAPVQYAQPPNVSNHERPPSQDHHIIQQHPEQPRQHNSRVYHHTPQSMSQVITSTPAPTLPAKATTHHHQMAQPPRQPPPPPPPSMAPPTTAPPGQPPTHYAPPPMTHKSEKEKMLAGLPFLPFDRQLVDERTHCTGAVFRFNSTSSAAVSIANEERGRLFKSIVAARWIPPQNAERHPGAHLGGNGHVATPFHCDYGYNLSIAENVVIGPDCQLLDSARICIGRNTKIGARVTISTMKTPTDTKALKGSNGTEVAQEVWIGENVYIGDGCIIEAGVKIGDYAIVRAGSVVVRDISRDCIAHGNPAFG